MRRSGGHPSTSPTVTLLIRGLSDSQNGTVSHSLDLFDFMGSFYHLDSSTR